MSTWPRDWGAMCRFPVNMHEDSSWEALVWLGAGCLCFLHSPIPVPLSASRVSLEPRSQTDPSAGRFPQTQ